MWGRTSPFGSSVLCYGTSSISKGLRERSGRRDAGATLRFRPGFVRRNFLLVL
jgi:hypothetical protein